MPGQRGDGPEHAGARPRTLEATVRGLVAGAVADLHAAHAATLQDVTGSAKAFLGEAPLPALRALNGGGPSRYSRQCTES